MWLYFRFCLSFRDVEELLLERGVVVTSEAIRKWCRKVGQPYANQLCRRRPRPGDKWHLHEVCLPIKGEHPSLWRAVAQDGNVLDILVQRRRDKQAAKKFFRKLLKGLTYVPRVIVTDKLKSYGAAKRELLPGVEHRQHRYLNNRAETPTNPLATASDAGNGLSPLAKPSGSGLLMVLSCSTSAHVVPASLRLPTVKQWRTDSTSGRKSQPRDWLHKKRLQVALALSLLMTSSARIS